MDKPAANPDRVMEELSHYELLSEAWGGDTIFVPISALKGTGVEQLLEMIQLVAEMKDLKLNIIRATVGTITDTDVS